MKCRNCGNKIDWKCAVCSRNYHDSFTPKEPEQKKKEPEKWLGKYDVEMEKPFKIPDTHSEIGQYILSLQLRVNQLYDYIKNLEGQKKKEWKMKGGSDE